MAERRDEIEAAVNSVVNDVSAIKTALVMEVALELVVDVADNGAEARGQKIHSVSNKQWAVTEFIRATARSSKTLTSWLFPDHRTNIW